MKNVEPKLKDVLKAVNDLASSTAAGFKYLTKEIGSVRTELSSEIASVRTELFTEIGSVRTELSSEIASVRTELSKKIETEIGSLRSEMRAEFRNIEKRVDALESKIDQMEKTNNDEVLILSGDLIELKSRVHKLEQKIAKLKLVS